MTKYNDEVCYSYCSELTILYHKHDCKIISVYKNPEYVNNHGPFGDYIVDFKIRRLESVYIGAPGTYIKLNGVKYEVNEDTIGKINTILYNREMNEAIDSL